MAEASRDFDKDMSDQWDSIDKVRVNFSGLEYSDTYTREYILLIPMKYNYKSSMDSASLIFVINLSESFHNIQFYVFYSNETCFYIVSFNLHIFPKCPSKAA